MQHRSNEKYVGLCACLLLLLLLSCAAKPLNTEGSVSVWMSRADESIDQIADRLPGLVKTDAPSDEPWLKQLAESEEAPDLISLEVSRDLIAATMDGRLLDIRHYWQRLTSAQRVWPSLQHYDTDQQSRFFIPTSVHTWGLFYNKELLSSMGLEPPSGWTEFEVLLSELKDRDIIPLALGSSFGWPVLAWISYLDMRFNGLTAHLELLEGKRDFTDPSLKPVFATLERWRNNRWFDADSHGKNWPEALADVDSGKAAFNLMGAFAVNRFARPQTIGFILVPMKDAKLDGGELSVVQGFSLSAKAPNPEAALALVDAYIAAGSPGQTFDAFRLPSLALEDETSLPTVKAIQAKGLAEAKGTAPQMDRIFSNQAAYDANQAAIRFFSKGSTMTSEELARALQATRRWAVQSGS